VNAAPGTVSMTGDASSGSPYAAVCAWKRHWPDYLKEAAGLMIFMLGAGAFTTLFEHPGSPVRMAISSDLARHVALGCVMGLVTAGIIYSPWGQRSGHIGNPSAGHQRLFDDPRLLLVRPSTPALDPAQNLDPHRPDDL